MSKPFQFSMRQLLWVTASFCVAFWLWAKVSAHLERERVTLPHAPFILGCASVGTLMGAFACPSWKSKIIVLSFAAAIFVLAVFMILSCA
ncbi:MAG TPA: hypothetical protein VGY55_09160 [Pirellulales bacterium]|nr:hypothetical protein [Pirellulales bacterium]